jgi:hypothetical protein
MKGLSHARRSNSRRLKQLVEPKKATLSVTCRDVTQRVAKSPSKRYKELKPWIDLANWAPKLRPGPAPPELTHQIDTESEASFPRVRLRSLVERGEMGHEAALSQYFISLVWKFWKTLYAVAVDAHGGEIPGISSDYEIVLDDGIVRMETVRSPFDDFARVLEGTEAARLRRCPVCSDFYYAARTTKPACSPRCGSTVRVRHHREYQDNRKRNKNARKLRRSGEWLKTRRVLL